MVGKEDEVKDGGESMRVGESDLIKLQSINCVTLELSGLNSEKRHSPLSLCFGRDSRFCPTEYST